MLEWRNDVLAADRNRRPALPVCQITYDFSEKLPVFPYFKLYGNGIHNHGIAAKIPYAEAHGFQQRHRLPDRLDLPQAKVKRNWKQKSLSQSGVCFKAIQCLFVDHPLVGKVLIDEYQAVLDMRQDIFVVYLPDRNLIDRFLVGQVGIVIRARLLFAAAGLFSDGQGKRHLHVFQTQRIQKIGLAFQGCVCNAAGRIRRCRRCPVCKDRGRGKATVHLRHQVLLPQPHAYDFGNGIVNRGLVRKTHFAFGGVQH